MTTYETDTLKMHSLGADVDKYLHDNFSSDAIVRMLALHTVIGGDITKYLPCDYDDNIFIVPCDDGYLDKNSNNNIRLADYIVLTDYEADIEARKSIKDYLDDELDSLPNDYLREYFDEEGFINDVIRIDGRGLQIAHYDSEELEAIVDGKTYYIYRLR